MEHSVIDYIFGNDEMHEMVCETKKFKEVSESGFKAYCKLRDSLNKEQLDLFDKFEEMMEEERYMDIERYFKAGVKIGVRFVSECMFD